MWNVLPTYSHRHLVTMEETNMVGNVYFAHYLRWQGHCRERFLMEEAPGLVRALTGDLALVTVNCHCDFFVELRGADTVELRMSLAGLEAHRVTLGFDYYRLNGATPELVARGGQAIACMRRGASGMEPVPVPEELRQALEPYAPT